MVALKLLDWAIEATRWRNHGAYQIIRLSLITHQIYEVPAWRFMLVI
jgi:hypothetical protein